MINLHLQHPYWLFAALPLLFLIRCLHTQDRNDDHWRHACDPHLLPHLLLTEVRNTRWIKPALASMWLFCIMALSGPCFSQTATTLYRQQDALVIALDMSSTLLANDITPNRATRANYKVLDILRQRQEGQTGMLVFTALPFVVSPLTDDARTIAAMIPSLHPNMLPTDGSNIGAALHKSADLMRQAGFSKGRILIICSNSATNNDQRNAATLARQGFTTSVLAIGSEQAVPLSSTNGLLQDANGNVRFARTDMHSLRALASAGQGNFALFRSDDIDLQHLFKQHTAQGAKQAENEQTTLTWRDSGYVFVWLLLPCVLLLFRRGWFHVVVKK